MRFTGYVGATFERRFSQKQRGKKQKITLGRRNFHRHGPERFATSKVKSWKLLMGKVISDVEKKTHVPPFPPKNTWKHVQID